MCTITEIEEAQAKFRIKVAEVMGFGDQLKCDNRRVAITS
jgi:hypothetical protein